MSAKYHRIIDHYEKCFRKYGDTYKGVDWPDSDGAMIRYKTMLAIVPSKGEYTLLDFGCGTALLNDFLIRNAYKNIRYSGLDISEVFVSFCKKKYAKNEFILCDILMTPDQVMKYDYIVLNGVFTEKLDLTFENMFDYFKRMIKILFQKAKIGLAFNVMSKHVDYEREDLFHLPFDLLAGYLKREVSSNFIIRNDYGLYEYTVYLFKNSNRWPG